MWWPVVVIVAAIVSPILSAQPTNCSSRNDGLKDEQNVNRRRRGLLPFELHVPGYKFCGPGTDLEKRLRDGDSPVNGLDHACKEHDKAYTDGSEVSTRRTADRTLADRAWDRVTSSNASLGERATSLLVYMVMKIKASLFGK